MGAFLARRQHDSPLLYTGVQRITWTKIESPAKRPRENDCPLVDTLVCMVRYEKRADLHEAFLTLG